MSLLQEVHQQQIDEKLGKALATGALAAALAMPGGASGKPTQQEVQPD